LAPRTRRPAFRHGRAGPGRAGTGSRTRSTVWSASSPTSTPPTAAASPPASPSSPDPRPCAAPARAPARRGGAAAGAEGCVAAAARAARDGPARAAAGVGGGYPVGPAWRGASLANGACPCRCTHGAHGCECWVARRLAVGQRVRTPHEKSIVRFAAKKCNGHKDKIETPGLLLQEQIKNRRHDAFFSPIGISFFPFGVRCFGSFGPTAVRCLYASRFARVTNSLVRRLAWSM
jgi:hypothetical protein